VKHTGPEEKDSAGDSAKPVYFGKAAGAADPARRGEETGIHSFGGVLGVKLKVVKCKRLQKDFEKPTG
jgi:hypothetical protein